MFIVSGGKGTGKTKTLLMRAKAEDGVVVCENPDAMRERAHGYGITGLTIVRYTDLLGDCYDKPVFVHDISKFMHTVFQGVTGYSINLD